MDGYVLWKGFGVRSINTPTLLLSQLVGLLLLVGTYHQARSQSSVYEFYKIQNADIGAAAAANSAQNYAEAIRLWRKVDAAPDVRTAFPGIVLDSTDQNFTRLGERLTDNRLAYEYAKNMAWARYQIAFHYMKGLGVPLDYTTAANWYQKSKSMGELAPAGTNQWLGDLYFYGLGVPRDPVKARALWGEDARFAGVMAATAKSYIRLMDHNMLPRRFEDWDHFDWRAANAKVDAEDAAKENAAATDMARTYRSQNPAPAPTRSAPSESQAPSWFACHHVLGAMGGMMGCSPW